MCRVHALVAVATIIAGVTAGGPSFADGSLTSPSVPPDPTPGQVEQNVPDLANPLNKPITGGSEDPLVVGTPPPPSLESLQAIRPGDEKGDGLEPGRADMLHTAALTYGAQGGLAARSFAINEMLRRYQAQLDSPYDFGSLVLPVGRGQTLMRPPIVSAAQMAFALGDGGQVARETSCIYQITREAQLASTPPNWRAYLVRVWSNPRRPTDGTLPRTKQEAAYWNKWVAVGWNATSWAWRGTACCCGLVLSNSPRSPSRTSGSTVGETVCMSAIRPSASLTSPGCRGIRVVGCQARDASNEPSCAAWPMPQAN